MLDMIALKNTKYGRLRLTAGERFQAKPRDARVMQALRLAEAAPVVAAPAPRASTYMRRDMTAETPTPTVAAKKVPAKKTVDVAEPAAPTAPVLADRAPAAD